jgi:hypothetical protein
METADLSHNILSRFNNDLEGVRSAVLQMGGLVEQQLQDGVRALVNGDSRLGEEVAKLDHKVNAMEIAIDDDCSRILATRAPAASDLRLLVAVLKTITDLERIGAAEKQATSPGSTRSSVDDRCGQAVGGVVGTWSTAHSTRLRGSTPRMRSRWRAAIGRSMKSSTRSSGSASRS